jgi:hypothetical protein
LNQLHYITTSCLPRGILLRVEEWIAIQTNNPSLKQFGKYTIDGIPSYYMNSYAMKEHAVTSQRVKQYAMLKAGDIDETEVDGHWEEIKVTMLSMHQIQRIDKDGKQYMRCDCKKFIHTGFVCSHVLCAFQWTTAACKDLAANLMNPAEVLKGGKKGRSLTTNGKGQKK